jgi:hypothetical protein
MNKQVYIVVTGWGSYDAYSIGVSFDFNDAKQIAEKHARALASDADEIIRIGESGDSVFMIGGFTYGVCAVDVDTLYPTGFPNGRRN